jgi:hypothetical protein
MYVTTLIFLGRVATQQCVAIVVISLVVTAFFLIIEGMDPHQCLSTAAMHWTDRFVVIEFFIGIILIIAFFFLFFLLTVIS